MPLLLMSFLLLSFSPQKIHEPIQTPSAKYFIVIFSPGPQWNHEISPRDQPGMKEHSANLQKLRKDGMIAVGARYSDKGMVVIKGDSLDAVKNLFADDPMVKENVFMMEVYEWKPFYKGSVE